MILARKLAVAHFDLHFGCTEAKAKDFQRMGHAATDEGAEGWVVEPSFWVVGGFVGVGGVRLVWWLWWGAARTWWWGLWRGS